MPFVVDFLMWSAVVGAALCVPLAVRAWRREVLRADDPQFRATARFPRFVRFVRRVRGTGSGSAGGGDEPELRR